MNIKIKYWLFFLLLPLGYATAQKNFAVYHVTGLVNIIQGSKIVKASRGDSLSRNKYLQIKDNASCMLIAYSGKSLQLKIAGTYSFEKIQELFSKENTDEVTKKFFAYVYGNFFVSNKSEPLGVAPVVFRGEKLMLLPLNNSIILSEAVTFTWKKPLIKTPVRLSLTNDAGKIIIDTVIKKGNSLKINFTEKGITPKHVYQWKMEESDTHQPKNYFLHFLVGDKKQSKKIISDLNLLRDKKLSVKLKEQMQQDIFEKWKLYYSSKDE